MRGFIVLSALLGKRYTSTTVRNLARMSVNILPIVFRNSHLAMLCPCMYADLPFFRGDDAFSGGFLRLHRLLL